MVTRRGVLAGTAALAAAPFVLTRGALAQAAGPVAGWPNRSVRVISPAGTGGPGQNFRFYADDLKRTFGQSFVLENLPGGSGAIGCSAVARAAPDGQTLLLASNSQIVLAPLVLPNYPVDGRRDFAPIFLMYTFPFLLVANPGLGVKTLADLVSYAKSRPGELNYGSPGVGTGGHIVSALLVKRTGINAVHIPYQATTQQLLACAAGTLQFTFDTVGNARGLFESGKVIPLAVTGAKRASAAPDVPTFQELGYPDFEQLFVANGLMAPAGTPSPIIQALNREMARLNASGAIRDMLLQASYEVAAGTPEDYAALIERDNKVWSAIVNETGVRIKS